MESIIKETLASEEITEMACDIRPMKTSNCTVSSSRLRIHVTPHPLRWDRQANRTRLTAHIHPLRLVHTSDIYAQFNGRWMCDIHGGNYMLPTYVFHCPQCLFDICIPCVSKPCLNCTPKSCYHTRIKIDMV